MVCRNDCGGSGARLRETGRAKCEPHTNDRVSDLFFGDTAEPHKCANHIWSTRTVKILIYSSLLRKTVKMFEVLYKNSIFSFFFPRTILLSLIKWKNIPCDHTS